MRSNGKASRFLTRDPERTRGRILAAALCEFAAHGFAGARVDAIARRARGNKRMLYHYFGNKKKLFTAVLRQKMAERHAWAKTLPNDPSDRLPFWFKTACDDTDWIRLLEWEALQSGPEPVIDERERRAISQDWLRRMRQRQRSGKLTGMFDPRHSALAMQSLTLFPAAFPQLVRLTTGQSVNDRKFQREYGKFLAALASTFKPAK